MTIEVLDREQIKRDADDVLESELLDVTHRLLARHCLALLAALEQVERENENLRHALGWKPKAVFTIATDALADYEGE